MKQRTQDLAGKTGARSLNSLKQHRLLESQPLRDPVSGRHSRPHGPRQGSEVWPCDSVPASSPSAQHLLLLVSTLTPLFTSLLPLFLPRHPRRSSPSPPFPISALPQFIISYMHAYTHTHTCACLLCLFIICLSTQTVIPMRTGPHFFHYEIPSTQPWAWHMIRPLQFRVE